MKKYLLSTTLIFASLTVFAKSPMEPLAEGRPACFEREYSAAHMNKHPLQTVKNMKLKFFIEPDWPEQLLLNVNVLLKSPDKPQYDPYKTSMFCYNVKKNSLECAIECDGGRIEVTWKSHKQADGSILLINHGFVVYGGCGEFDEDGEPVEGRWLAPIKGGDDIFRLHPVQCQ